MKNNQNATVISQIFGPDDIVSRYSRAQAIEDGYLADITEIARQAGFKISVAISTGIYSLINEAVEKGARDFTGIVWDILSILKLSARNSKGPRTDFQVKIWSKYTGKDKLTDLYAICGPGDNAEPVITILLPHED